MLIYCFIVKLAPSKNLYYLLKFLKPFSKKSITIKLLKQ